jgi:hypothetical protein
MSDPLDTDRLLDVFKDSGTVSLESETRVVVEGDWGWFAIGTDTEIEGELSESERARIIEIICRPLFAQLEYNTSAAADLAVELLPSPEGTLIDNDHGMVLPIEQVRWRILTGIEWQASSSP